MVDSTVQAVGYWDMNEKQSYFVSLEKLKIAQNDTTSRDFFQYAVDITVVDSNASSYTLDWFYHDFNIQTNNDFINKVSSIAEDMTITIKTDELGVFKEVVNWEEIQAYIYNGISLLRTESENLPNVDQIIEQLKGLYSSKEMIEAAAIKEIRQFYTFHGGKYKLGKEITANMKVNNLYGKDPFDAELQVSLDEINVEDNNSIIRMKQTVDSEQLTKSTFEYLTRMATTMGVSPPEWEEFPVLINETWTASRIHGSGWLIYSIETKEVSTENALNIEERIIEIQ
jgi:hypothetical protein